MKLLIDIPEEDYVGIRHLTNEQLQVLPEEVAETLIRIANGIPLNKIRAEIEAIDVTMGIKDYPFIPKAKVLNVIDNYTKGE